MPGTEPTREALDRARKQLPERLEDATERQETLMIWMDHSATGHRCWRADIHREPTRLDPWRQQEGEQLRGRLMGMVEWRS